MSKPLVSIITPCYNGEKSAHRMIESVLSQTYSPIEYIFINDGSTDKTEELFNSYLPQFKEKGIKVIYKYQENAGQSAAVNQGLKLFTGDYLSWADADDILFPESVEKRVAFLEEHPEYGCVQSDAYIVKEDDINKPIKKLSQNFSHSAEEDQFELCLTGKSIICCHGFMVRTSALVDAIPSLDIYTGRKEQNLQLFLPIYYKYKRYFLDEPLCSYVVSSESHSHGQEGRNDRLLKQTEGYIDIFTTTLNSIEMPENERKKYIEMVMNIYAHRKLGLSVELKDKTLAKEQVKILKDIGALRFRDRFTAAAAGSPILTPLYKIFRKFF